MAHAHRKHRKQFDTCEHRGFGKTCHACNPNEPRNRDKALAGAYGPKVQRKEEAHKPARVFASKAEERRYNMNKKGNKA